MKQQLKKYTFALLSVGIICSYFVFTGGVTDSKQTLISPPKIDIGYFTGQLNEVGVNLRFYVDITNIDPATYVEQGDCNGTVYDQTTVAPYSEYEIYAIAPNSAERTLITYDNNVNQSQSYNHVAGGPYAPVANNYFLLDYSFSQPGIWTILVRARAVSFVDRTRVRDIGNGDIIKPGVIERSNWTEKSFPVTISGEAPMQIKRYIIDRLKITPGSGVTKIFTLTDPSTQYLDVVSATRASLRFKATFSAQDTVTYPNLQTKYDIDYQNAPYQITLNNQGAVAVFDYTLSYSNGLKANFTYNKPENTISYFKPSKNSPVPDLFTFYLR